MDNLVWIPTNSKKAMEEELLRGRDMANQVLEVLTFDDKSNIIREIKGSNLKSSSSSKVLPLSVAEDLVREVLKSFTNTILLLNNNQESNDVAVPITVGDYSLSTNCHMVEEEEEDLGRSCKKLKTLNTKNIPKGSNKRKSISPTWEKTTSILIDDGHAWRKYGQKKITNAKYFRSYYRCTHMDDQYCEAIKHVQRTQENPPLYRTTYYGHHTCTSSFHSNINLESNLSSDDSSILLSFDKNILNKQEYSFPQPPSPPSPRLTSTKEEFKEEIHDDYFAQNQLFSPQNILSCDFEVYFDYLRHVTMITSSESFEFENVYDQFGF
ncbi:probable WRKY transcription factor 62 [Trifolium pratense]|uniref:probable WRKY transcription factor 62 n=1 Tax=Trifolium pratense TaxID=57577 RepID=UPI001E697E21|nr:probable WRKY transcription factor 62 [Trifolium pratense]